MAKIAFVSFKGGAGRSVTLANVAFQTAVQKGKSVGCIDADLESGGLHTIFNVDAPYDQFQRDSKSEGNKFPIQVFLMNERARSTLLKERNISFDVYNQRADLVAQHFAINIATKTGTLPLRDRLRKSKHGSIHLIPASPNTDFTMQVEASGNLYNHFYNLLDAFEVGCKLDTIFVDCRSGISALNLPALAFVDATVICLRWGQQHRAGTERFIRWYSSWLKQTEGGAKLYLLVSLMDQSDIQEKVRNFLEERKLSELIAETFFIPHDPGLASDDRIILDSGSTEYSRAIKHVAEELATVAGKPI